jgi:hypothetical protein
MSYDLYFRLRSTGSQFQRESFVGYFKDRPHYEVKESHAWYSNEDSGVYFSFEYSERSEESDAENETDSSLLPVAFNLNYFRPHPFGLEAEPEVATFVREFDLTVSDPQLSGMGDGEYTKDGFLRGWNAGNAFGYRAIVSQDSARRYLTLPASRIEALWRWNFDCERRQNEIGDSEFVPRIFFLDQGGEVRTCVAWGDGIPILLPVVDVVLVPRQRLAPRRSSGAKSEIVVFTWEEVQPIIRRFRMVPGEPESYELFYDATPPDIERSIREKQPPREMPKGVGFDQVLDQELVEQAKSG